MKLVVFSTKDFEIEALQKANAEKHTIKFVSDALDSRTAILAAGSDAISIFSGDDASLVVLEILKELGVNLSSVKG